jgi:hypothetical protein
VHAVDIKMESIISTRMFKKKKGREIKKTEKFGIKQ